MNSIKPTGAEKRWPEMTDDVGWQKKQLGRYRSKSRAYCLLISAMALPFCLIYWGAQQGQAAMQALTEDREPTHEK